MEAQEFTRRTGIKGIHPFTKIEDFAPEAICRLFERVHTIVWILVVHSALLALITWRVFR